MIYYIGIDIGTGSTKAVSIGESCSDILLTKQVTYPTFHPEFHLSEQSPESIFQAFLSCIAQTVSQLGSPAGIGISSAMHSLIPVNKEGDPLMNMITWADRRGEKIASQIKSLAVAEELYKITGTPIHAMTPMSKIIWLKENAPNIFNATHKFISIKEYIWHKLFQAYEIDDSIASGSGLYDFTEYKFHETALNLAGITKDMLSTPVRTSYQRSDLCAPIADKLGLNPKTPWVIGASDGCLANLGSQAILPGVASLTIGTSGAIRIANSKPSYDFNKMTFNYRLDEDLLISGGPINNGGGVWKWYTEQLLGVSAHEESYKLLLAAAGKISPGSEGLLFLPYLTGERAPIWNSRSTGVFFGIQQQHQQAHFSRAVLEGISFALYSVGKGLEDVSGKIECLYASGGFVKSSLWVQIIADIFNKRVYVKNMEDASAIGAVLMAIKSITQMTHYPSFQGQEDSKVVDPVSQNSYLELFPLFERLYMKLKEEMDLVYEINSTQNHKTK